MHAIRQRLGNVEWTDNLIITAINAKSGQLATFNKQSHIALEEAVGASGAVQVYGHTFVYSSKIGLMEE